MKTTHLLSPLQMWPTAVSTLMRWGDTEPAQSSFPSSVIEEAATCQVGQLLTEPTNTGRCAKLLLSIAITGTQEAEGC